MWDAGVAGSGLVATLHNTPAPPYLCSVSFSISCMVGAWFSSGQAHLHNPEDCTPVWLCDSNFPNTLLIQDTDSLSQTVWAFYRGSRPAHEAVLQPHLSGLPASVRRYSRGWLLSWEVLSYFHKGPWHIQHPHFIFIMAVLASRNIFRNYLIVVLCDILNRRCLSLFARTY